MKVCVVNINNCVDYSQYGPFFFENIKNGKLAIYNSVKNTSGLEFIYDKLVEEVNRNAFSTEKIKLIILIPRDLTRELSVQDYEFYNNINIYHYLINRLNIFEDVLVAYVDKTDTKMNNSEAYELIADIDDVFISDEDRLKGYIISSASLESEDYTKDYKACFANAVKTIDNDVFAQFYMQIINKELPEQAELKDIEIKEMKKFFAGRCKDKFKKIKTECTQILRVDISDSICKNINIVDFINNLCKDHATVDSFKNHEADHELVRKTIATYKLRLASWLKTKFTNPYEEEKFIWTFNHLKLRNVSKFSKKIDEIISTNLKELDDLESKSIDAVNLVFEKLDKIVKHADEEMRRFTSEDIGEYFKDENYNQEDIDVVFEEPFDDKKKEEELLEQLNTYSALDLPGFTEQLRLEQRLEDANKKIEELLRCKREYSFNAFVKTFLFAGAGVVLLYFLAQYSVFFKENSLWIFGMYSAVTLALFFGTYAANSINANKKIAKLLNQCKLEVGTFLENYKKMAEEFEENLNRLVDYYCFKEYLTRKEECEKKRKICLEKFNWHKKKVREILESISHFNDYTKDSYAAEEGSLADFTNYDHDAEHTTFYQMKIF